MVLQQLDQLTDTCGDDPSWICEQVLDWSSGNEFLARSAEFLLAKPLKILLIVVLAIIVNRLLRKAIRGLAERIATGTAPGANVVRNVRDRTPGVLTSTGANDLRSIARAQTIGQVLRSIATAVVFAVAALMVLGEIGINLGPLLAGAGIAGVAIGFGAQSLVKDFLSGMFMLLEDQYGVGDVIDVGEAIGTVEAVTLRSTRLRDMEGTVWHVPNGQILRVGNKSQQWARAVIDVAVAYGTDIRVATEIIERVAADVRDEPEWARLIQEDPEVLGVEALGADGVNIRLIVQTEPGEQFKVMRELRMRLREAMDTAGIEAPFQRTKVVGDPVAPAPAAKAKAKARKATPPKAGT
jgi:small-conductance mechanosensitive channel